MLIVILRQRPRIMHPGNLSLSQLFSRVLRDSTPRFVGPSVGPSVRPSVGPSVRPSHFTFSALMGFLALLLLPK